MAFQALLLVAIGLSMDAFGAAISRGALIGRLGRGAVVQVAAVFGGFAMATPVVGWAVGVAFYDLIAALDHWIAFGLLSVVGSKMIVDASSQRGRTAGNTGLRAAILVTSALATNIDAGIFGVTLPIMHVNLFTAAATIGLTTFAASFAGMHVGRATGAALGHKAEIVGGAVLILVGLKILLDHTYFAG